MFQQRVGPNVAPAAAKTWFTISHRGGRIVWAWQKRSKISIVSNFLSNCWVLIRAMQMVGLPDLVTTYQAMGIAFKVLGRKLEQLRIFQRFQLMDQAYRDIHALTRV